MGAQTAIQGNLGERRYDLDWVRICAFMLLILYHVGMYYVTWDWHVKSPHASTTVEPLMMLTSPWRLSLLFLVSGVATAYLYERQGTRGFLGQRSVRLLVPLLFGMAVIVPPQSYLEVVEKLSYAGTYADFLKLYFTAYHGFCRGSDCLALPTWNHLWFVPYLWVYTVVLYAVIRLVPTSINWLRRVADSKLGGLGIVVWPLAFLAIARIALIAAYPPNHALAGDWYNHATYGMTFLLGFALAGTRAPWVAIEGSRWGRDASVRQKTEAVRADEGLIDVHPAIDEDSIAQAAAGVDQQGSDTAGGAFVDGISFDAADLGDVDEFIGIERRARTRHQGSPSQMMRLEYSKCQFTSTTAGSVRASLRSW